MRWEYDCKRARKQLSQLATKWIGQKLVKNLSQTKAFSAVKLCESCDNAGSPSACTGWTVTIARESPWSLGPFPFRKGQPVLIDLSAYCNFRRPAPATQDEWQKLPVEEAIFAVEIFDGAKSRLITRHHLDLGERDQVGPVWHWQVGGHAEFSPLPESWLDLPRWPAQPMDVALFMDTVAFNFAPAQWRSLHSDTSYRSLIGASETLMLTEWVRMLADHLSQPHTSRKRTMMRLVDNKADAGWMPVWQPRPRQA